MSASVSSRQGSASAGAAPGQTGMDDAAFQQAAALFQQMIGQPADPATLASEQQALAGGASPQDLRGVVAHSDAAASAINGFYRDVLGVGADPQALASVETALGAGQSLAQAEAAMRPQFAHSATAQASIQALYQGVAGRAATGGELASSEAALAAGQSLQDVRQGIAHSDTAAAAINGFYRDVLGVDADPQALVNVQTALGAGQSLAQAEAGLRPQFAHSATAQASIQALYQGVAGRAAGAGELASSEDALAHGQSLDQMRSVLLNSGTASAPARQVNALYQQVLGRDADLGGLAASEAALAGGASVDQLRSGLAHSDEAGRDIGSFYQEVLGRPAEAAGVAHWQDQLAGGEAVGDVRSDIARSPEGVAQVQADFAQRLGRPASASEIEGYQAAKWTAAAPGAAFTVSSGAGVLGTADAQTIVAELGAFVTLSGGQTPMLTGPDGQVTRFRNAAELAGFALAMAERSGQATPTLLKTYDLTVSWLGQVGQADIQAAANLQAMAQADAAAGHAQGAYLESVGAQLAMQIQATPPEQRHALTQRVSLGGQVAADVTVTGDAGDRQGLAGFRYAMVDTDPDRTRLVAAAQSQVAAAAQDAGNPLLAALDNAQARVDVAYAGLPAGARTDKMLGVAQQFVDAGRGAAAAGNWNLVQTLETAADVSLQIAAQPEGSRSKLTERFMHKDVKHDITVDPNAPDPFASFQDHSKGEDAVGAIVQGVVGVVVNLATLIPGSQGFTVPLAVAWDAGQAGKNFADGNVLGGVLNLGAAVGVGLSGLSAVSQAGVGAAPGSFAANAGQMADSIAGTLGFTDTAATATTAAVSAAQAAGHVGAEVLEGTALLGGLSGAAQSAAHGDPLGIAAGVLEAASAVAGGLVTEGTLTSDAARAFAHQVSVGAGMASVGASSLDAFAHGDLAGGLLASLDALLTQVAHEALDPPATAKPPGTAPAGSAGDPGSAGGGGAGPFNGPGVGGTTASPDTTAPGGSETDIALPAITVTAPYGSAPGGDSDVPALPLMPPDAAPSDQALAAQGGAVAAIGGAAATNGVAETFGQWAARMLGLSPEILGGAVGGAAVFALIPTPAGTPPQTSATAVDGFTTRQAQDETLTALQWTDPSGKPASVWVRTDTTTGALTLLDGQVVGQLANGQMLFDPQALAALKAGTLAAMTDPSQSTPGTGHNSGETAPASGTPDTNAPAGATPPEDPVAKARQNRLDSLQSRIDSQKGALDESHLDAAQRELEGEVVKINPRDGQPFDHVTEVKEAQQGLLNVIEDINKALGHPRLDPIERADLTDKLAQASRLLDHSEQFVP